MPLFKLYSPQLITSQNDHILSRNSKNLAGGGLMQLRAFGVQKRALNQIKNIKKPLDLVPFYAERGGFAVSELNLREGGYVKRGMLLARIQDYSSVWLIVGVAKDLSCIGRETPRVCLPQPARPRGWGDGGLYLPDHRSQDPHRKVRPGHRNPDGHIRPGSYADVDFEVVTDQRIAVPTESILKNGEGRHVVISLHGQGQFQPRLIQDRPDGRRLDGSDLRREAGGGRGGVRAVPVGLRERSAGVVPQTAAPAAFLVEAGQKLLRHVRPLDRCGALYPRGLGRWLRRRSGAVERGDLDKGVDVAAIQGHATLVCPG